MLSIRHSLPILCLLMSLGPAHTQEAALQPQPDQVAQAAEGVRRATAALRTACASLPLQTAAPLPPLEANKPPVPVARPYGTEEDICLFVNDPNKAVMAYAWPIGFMGGAVTLLAFGFFALIGGIMRALWHGPMIHLERLFARRSL